MTVAMGDRVMMSEVKTSWGLPEEKFPRPSQMIEHACQGSLLMKTSSPKILEMHTNLVARVVLELSGPVTGLAVRCRTNQKQSPATRA